MKPRIFWKFYPKSKRGFWCVSPMLNKSTRSRDRWALAHSMAREMNAAVNPATGRP